MILYHKKMLFILPGTPTKTTGRSFLLACKALYMKFSGSPGEKVVFWSVVSPRICIVYVDLYLCMNMIDLYLSGSPYALHSFRGGTTLTYTTSF